MVPLPREQRPNSSRQHCLSRLNPYRRSPEEGVCLVLQQISSLESLLGSRAEMTLSQDQSYELRGEFECIRALTARVSEPQRSMSNN